MNWRIAIGALFLFTASGEPGWAADPR